MYISFAYRDLAADRTRYAGLAAQRPSAVLSYIAEQHSIYMASIGGWSDGDPAGGILERVRDAGLDATYAGQNVVTATAASVPEAVEQGEAFFAAEAENGGPHWQNITNPNHHYVGMGLVVNGAQGAYTIYLTQVFSDAGGCSSTVTSNSFAPAANISVDLKPGSTVHPTVDELQLRSEPHGLVIGVLQPDDSLRVIETLEGWVHVKVVSTDTFGWVFGPLVAAA